MFKKAIVILSLLLMLLVISGVSAADNLTDVVDVADDKIDLYESENAIVAESDFIDENVYLNTNITIDVNSNFDNSIKEGLLKTESSDELESGKTSTYFEVTQNKIHNILTVHVMSGGYETNLPFEYSFDNDDYKRGSSTIKANFVPYTTHTLNLKYDGNWQYEACAKTITFQVLSSIDFDEKGTYTTGGMNFKYYITDNDGKTVGTKTIFAPFGTSTLKLYNEKTGQTLSKTVNVKHSIFLDENGVYTDGGMNFKYTVYNQNGNSIQYLVFAPFGKSTISVRNSLTGETINKEVNVKKRTLEASDLVVDYNDIIEYKVRVTDANDNFSSGMYATFVINGNTYSNSSDKNGYVTLKIHLTEGKYPITTKYAGLVEKNTITVNPIHVSNNYKDMYIKSSTTYYNQYKWFDFGWKGYFKGYFKIYKGNSLVESRDLDSSGYVGDYIIYEEHRDGYHIGTLPVGTYQAKIIDMGGNVVAQSTIEIIKTSTKIKVSSITAKPDTMIYISANVYDKSSGCDHNGGKVKFNINGKKYYAKVKKGTAKIKIKAPSKLKTYTCKATFLGDNNAKSSSKTFKIVVKKSTTKKTTTKKKKTTSFTVVVPVKLNQYTSKTVGKYKFRAYKHIEYNSNGRDYGITTTLFKNNKAITLNKYEATYWWHFKSGTWKYMSKHTITYNEFSNVDKIKVKITIK